MSSSLRRLMFSLSCSMKRLYCLPSSSTTFLHTSVSNAETDVEVEPNKEDEDTIIASIKEKIRKKTHRVVGQPSELKKYLATFPFLVPTTSAIKKLYRVSRFPPDSVYLIDSNVASLISEKLSAENLDPTATVIEINPGFGILTSELKTKLGFKKINCFEEDPELGRQLISKYESEINLVPVNFISLPRIHYIDQIDGGERLTGTLNSVRSSALSAKNNKLYIFGACPVQSPISFATKSLITQKFIFDEYWNWDVTYYLVLGSKPFTTLSANPDSGFTEYRATSVTFQLLFNYECLGSFPRKAFLPWQSIIPKEKSENSRGQIRHDPSIMKLLKFKPNSHVISKVGVDGLTPLWYFIRHHLFVRRSAVIPELEQWIPGCGPRLIRHGYTIFTTFGSLSPEKIFELYLLFTSWPEFESCSFLTAVDKYMTKMEPVEGV